MATQFFYSSLCDFPRLCVAHFLFMFISIKYSNDLRFYYNTPLPSRRKSPFTWNDTKFCIIFQIFQCCWFEHHKIRNLCSLNSCLILIYTIYYILNYFIWLSLRFYSSGIFLLYHSDFSFSCPYILLDPTFHIYFFRCLFRKEFLKPCINSA